MEHTQPRDERLKPPDWMVFTTEEQIETLYGSQYVLAELISYNLEQVEPSHGQYIPRCRQLLSLGWIVIYNPEHCQ